LRCAARTAAAGTPRTLFARACTRAARRTGSAPFCRSRRRFCRSRAGRTRTQAPRTCCRRTPARGVARVENALVTQTSIEPNKMRRPRQRTRLAQRLVVVQPQVVAEPDDGHLAPARARARRLAAARGGGGKHLRRKRVQRRRRRRRARRVRVGCAQAQRSGAHAPSCRRTVLARKASASCAGEACGADAGDVIWPCARVACAKRQRWRGERAKRKSVSLAFSAGSPCGLATGLAGADAAPTAPGTRRAQTQTHESAQSGMPCPGVWPRACLPRRAAGVRAGHKRGADGRSAGRRHGCWCC
jgi:hypothetical protein